ncbi:glycerophosphodiester phosphodiesterase family protein [Streptomyces sp. NPDC005492]|uniref:glycerophosphodiester phosphodiesterase n=1 Tax=Streptomyces sp. NPDC005492 TaxID=3156883 RepID=UPI0033AB87B3
MSARRAPAVAHRGDPWAAVENTLDAVRRAAGAGAAAIEVDLRRTADGVVVLHHDDDLRRLWDRTESIADLTLAELRDLAPGVPTLREALEVAAGVPLLLDTGDPVVEVAAHAEVGRLGPVAMFCGAAEAVAYWHARDVLVSCWTVDDAGRARRTARLGVDAIISNDVNGVVKSCGERT